MDKKYKRLIEMIPGLLTWAFIILLLVLSFNAPYVVAYLIVFYTVYFIYESLWTFFLMVRASNKTNKVLKTNWLEELDKLDPNLKWKEYYHAIIIPYANETEDILKPTIEHIVKNDYPKERKIIVLATEERLEKGYELALKLKEEYKSEFFDILITRHPLTAGEIVGKASNQNFAARALYTFIKGKGIDTKKVIISSNDSDSRHKPIYMARLTHAYLSESEPEKRIYQPVPMFFNNIWTVPFTSRIVATFSALWQMSVSLRPHRFMNFSCYATCLETLHTIGYWDPDIIPEDERLFWRAVIHYGEDLKVVPLFIPVFMDAVKASTYMKSLQEQYVQIRRWAWGASELSYSLPNLMKSSNVPLYIKVWYLIQQLRKSFEWAITPFILMFGFSIPTYLNPAFTHMQVAYTIPDILSKLLTITTASAVTVFYIEAVFAPPKPSEWSILRRGFSMLQWITFPYVNIIFSAIPALDAQTRLLIGRPIQYKVTEKAK